MTIVTNGYIYPRRRSDCVIFKQHFVNLPDFRNLKTNVRKRPFPAADG